MFIFINHLERQNTYSSVSLNNCLFYNTCYNKGERLVLLAETYVYWWSRIRLNALKTEQKKICLQDFAFKEVNREVSIGYELVSYLEERILATGHNKAEQQNPNVFTKALVQSHESKKWNENYEDDSKYILLYILCPMWIKIYIYSYSHYSRAGPFAAGINWQCWSYQTLKDLRFCSQTYISMFNSTHPCAKDLSHNDS